MARKRQRMDYRDVETSEEKRKRQDPTGILDKLGKWQSTSKTDLTMYEQRWADNLKMMKGIWDVDEKSRSETRGRSKIFFRKVWSTVWRLMASLYTTYLRDPDQARLTGRMGNDKDTHKAGVLQVMVEYYRDRMYQEQNLFLQHVWGFYNILTYGVGVGLFSWEYNKDEKIDGPRFKIFEPEHVFPDMSATLESDMRYIIFESFHTMEQLKEMGYKNLDLIQPCKPENTPLRNIRHKNTQDPLQNPGENEYPSPGRYSEPEAETANPGQKYRVWQAFYKEGTKIHYCVSNGTEAVLKDPEVSKYGRQYPIVFGLCLTEPHKLIGEGFPEPLEGPQVSMNDIINRRKDNIHLVMNKHKYVSRFGNVDLSSLMNSRAGAVTLMDDVNAVKESEATDVTQSAYVEAGADDVMMQEMSGVTPAKQGMEKAATKATVAQINLTESNAKIDLFLAIVGETWMRSFYYKLTYLVQRFSTDQELLRVANETYRKKKNVDYHQMPYDIDDVDDFQADIVVEVGIGTVNRDNSIRETMLAMDKIVQANQSTIALLSIGAVPKESVKFFDIVKFMETLLPKIGYKNVQDYFIEIIPPPPQAPAGGEGMGGGMAPEVAQGLRGGLAIQPNSKSAVDDGSGGMNFGI